MTTPALDTSYSQGGTGIYFHQGNTELHFPSGTSLVMESGSALDRSQSANLGTGTLWFDLFGARTISGNTIPNSAATPSGGILTSNTAPSIARTNGATDKSIVVAWAASSVIELQLPTVLIPIDFDTTKASTLKLFGLMNGATDTPTVQCDVFPGIGGSNAGGASGAFGSSAAAVSVAIAASTFTYGQPTSVALTPGTHGTNILQLYAVWLEYTYKTS